MPTGQKGVLLHLHLPLDPVEQKAEAERYLAQIQEKFPEEALSEEERRHALDRLQQLVYQHRVGRFRVECRAMDQKQVLGTGTVQFEVVLKGRFSDLGLPGVPPRSDGGRIAPSAAPTFEASIPVVITIVPVAFVVPTTLVFIPPTMMFAPALLPRFPQLAAFVIGLTAVASMMFDRFVQIVFGMLDPALAPLIGLLA